MHRECDCLFVQVPNEEIIYNCVMSWIKHDQTFRQQYLMTLLQHVRLPYLGVRFITDICDNEVGDVVEIAQTALRCFLLGVD